MINIFEVVTEAKYSWAMDADGNPDGNEVLEYHGSYTTAEEAVEVAMSNQPCEMMALDRHVVVRNVETEEEVDFWMYAGV